MQKIFGLEEIFEARGDDYNKATRLYPRARQKERDLLLDMLPLQLGMRVCDAPAGGGYVAEGVLERTKGDCHMICVEPSKRFASGIPAQSQIHIGPVENMPFEDGSMDAVTNLAGLHHLDDYPKFFNEVYRVLKPGGYFAVADIREGTVPALFLNDSVHRYTDTGHEGKFLKEGELSEALVRTGFVEVHEDYKEYEWSFPDIQALVVFCRLLFGMTKATPGDVKRELLRYFDIRSTGDSAGLPWSLIYALGKK
jgi:ubiquinone/menaquinone biosynthesis C-methylase UbiE